MIDRITKYWDRFLVTLIYLAAIIGSIVFSVKLGIYDTPGKTITWYVLGVFGFLLGSYVYLLRQWGWLDNVAGAFDGNIFDGDVMDNR